MTNPDVPTTLTYPARGNRDDGSTTTGYPDYTDTVEWERLDVSFDPFTTIDVYERADLAAAVTVLAREALGAGHSAPFGAYIGPHEPDSNGELRFYVAIKGTKIGARRL